MTSQGSNTMRQHPFFETFKARDRAKFRDDIRRELDRCATERAKWAGMRILESLNG